MGWWMEPNTEQFWKKHVAICKWITEKVASSRFSPNMCYLFLPKYRLIGEQIVHCWDREGEWLFISMWIVIGWRQVQLVPSLLAQIWQEKAFSSPVKLMSTNYRKLMDGNGFTCSSWNVEVLRLFNYIHIIKHWWENKTYFTNKYSQGSSVIPHRSLTGTLLIAYAHIWRQQWQWSQMTMSWILDWLANTKTRL